MGWRVQRLRPVLGALVILTACQRGPDPIALKASAQYYLDHGGLALQPDSTGRVGGRPCLKALDTTQTLLGGLLGGPSALVAFIEAHALATVTHEVRASGYDKVTMTPVAPYVDNWVGEGSVKQFCFGTVSLLTAELVEDAAPITAGTDQPYLVPGIAARSVRITYRLDDLPDRGFLRDLEARPSLLTPTSMRPETYGREHSIVAVLPLAVDGYRVRP
ncbi:hypothetical protein [Deinococcus rufus]|uniref:Lipoprotein n=1 Tax=Deinococcus rufus TaxID=2136097 RepID=A0ABV7ZB54_9DEIO